MRTALRIAALTTVLGIASFASAQTASGPGWVWWEAESTSATNFPPRHSFEPANPREAAVLSEGKWLGAEGNYGGKKLFAEYKLKVPEAGKYRLYARKFWKHGPFTWTFNSASGSIGPDVPLLDDAYIRTFLGANWVYLGEVEAVGGEGNTFRLETTKTEGAVAFDCFILSRTPLQPRGKLKPNEKYNSAPEGFFPFEPDPDEFKESPLSMRRLNEAKAGEGGWIAARGRDLVHSTTGRPVRFWAVNTGYEAVMKDESTVRAQAKFWAKHGVNMVRVHGGVWDDADFTKLDTEKLKKLHFYVAALKDEGIYTHLSIYFPLWLNFTDKTAGFPGYPAQGQHPFAVQFFNPRFQEMQKSWMSSLLTPVNPHTSLTLANDPAVAMVEVINEDSYFFWTFTPYQNIPAPQMEILERAYAGYLIEKHGSLEAGSKDWPKQNVRGDDFAGGRVGFVPLYDMFNNKTPRGRAQAEFLARHQRAYFDMMRDHLKKTVGYKGLVTASNWTTADARTLYPLERWSNGSVDLLDRHGYWSGPHKGPRSSYSVSTDDEFADASSLVGPVNTPLWEVNWLDMPTIISEIGWTAPNRFRAELPFLKATYGAMQGNDGTFFFASSASSWEQQIGKFAMNTPVTVGQFPAASLIYRMGYVKEAGTALRNDLKLADMFALKGAPVPTQVNMDQIRFGDTPAEARVASDTISPLYFLVGRVEAAITETGGRPVAVDLSKYVDPKTKTATSMTGQLAWNFGDGIVSVSAEKANGLLGFLGKQKSFSLPVLKLETGMEYASVLLVPLDDQPLASSSRMLLQILTEDANDGFAAPPPGTGNRRITALGGPPLVVRNIEGSFTLVRPDAASLRVTKLDLNGYPATPTTPATPLGASHPLDPRTLYYLIEK
jgi:hypothetical protein